jgi:cytidine deaminase
MSDMDRQALVEKAREVRANAYAPYSVYHVGASVLGIDGGIYVGCNVENVSYGLTVCAERNALSAMVAAGCREVVAIAVATSDGGTPCGACRQALKEFAPEPAKVQVICVGDGGEVEYSLAELIPSGFDSSSVKKAEN